MTHAFPTRGSSDLHLVEWHAGVEAVVSAGERLDHRVLDVELVDDLAEQLLDDVLQADEAGGAAVLVDDDRHVEAVDLHLSEQLGHPLGLGHEAGRTGQLGHRALLVRSEEHTSELQSLMRISYYFFCLKKKKSPTSTHT